MTNTTVKKPTKKENFNAICAILTAAQEAGIELNGNEQITYESLIECMKNEVVLLDKKAEAAQKRAADRKVEGDALRDKIYEVMSDTDFMLIHDIALALNDPDVSDQMVTARLKQLKDLGKVEQDSIPVSPTTEGGKTKKLSAYRRLA